MKAFEGEDWTVEECHLLETALSSRPNGERTYRDILNWLGEKVFELAEKGEVLSCYSEAAEHALHPDGFGWADSSGGLETPVIPRQPSGNQVDTPVERIA